MSQELNNQLTKTSDLGLASVINIYSPLVKLSRADIRRVEFVFHKTPEIETLIRQYWQRALSIEPQAYFQSMKTLKSRIYGNE